jgi:DNA-binding transcriptional LysR family regulator
MIYASFVMDPSGKPMNDASEQLPLHLRRLRLRHFEVLLSIARHGSLTASALDSSQPAVSQWLAEIESAVGARLFERGRHLQPTPALDPVLRHAQHVVADGQRLARELAAVAGGALGTVRIGSMVVANTELMPRALLQLQQAGHPVQLEIVEDIAQGLIERFAKHNVDLIVGRLDERFFAPGLRTELLFRDAHCVVAGRRHPLLRGQPSWARAAAFPWMLPPSATALRRAIDATFVDHGLAPATPWIECTASVLNLRLLRDSQCLAVASGAAGRCYEEWGVLKRVALPLTHDVGPVGMVWHQDDDSPALQCVLQALRSVSAEARD